MSDVEEKALLAGGCFWGMQELIRALPGVERTRVGYSGDDDKPDPTYRDHGKHAESMEITFDPAVTDYRSCGAGTLVPAGPLWEAEPEHQDYLQRYPDGYTCHFPRPNWRLPRRGES
ncbi:peptide-methionine (S)-S-oxide reductase [Streptomyces mirabilis]|uniref:peptide-methionine (S)-S-oxide reductase n=1 Tax=Streptomyces mirabilis TaxID=68239 RepID=UPI0036CB5C33